jgi:hypothetical protein
LACDILAKKLVLRVYKGSNIVVNTTVAGG